MPRHPLSILNQLSNKLAVRRPINRLPLRRTICLPLINIKEPIPLLPPISPSSQLDDLRRSDFPNPERQQRWHRPGVEDVARVKESFLARGSREVFETRDGLFDRGVQARSIDREVQGEILEGRGQRVGGGSEVGCCSWRSMSMSGLGRKRLSQDDTHHCRTQHSAHPIAFEGKRTQGLLLLVWRGLGTGGEFRLCCLGV